LQKKYFWNMLTRLKRESTKIFLWCLFKETHCYLVFVTFIEEGIDERIIWSRLVQFFQQILKM
jgi:hypothetical protein